METVLKAFALGSAVLLAVAVLVACWEHWFRRIQSPNSALPESPRPVSVDLNVDQLPDSAPPSDQHARRATLGAALDAMARPPADAAAAPAPGAWIETRPMVLTSTKTESEPH
ncbi:MAG: hypothetical protein KA141_06045 [Rubrivivax sp.]|jgi:hypothetical protein|nr:hypothetical protein [Rubrivivax sp.]